ncbi:hypothetical protein SAMN05216190_12037 [Pseudomonas borbori]|uniref:Uncharacterized protein n=1 Tax=Pseudomonas borbori TaxID=289003 RepID=A0A1I5TIU0_9PSED|nr:hypothetical protein SAMN05216190_12037 [Pseudomonas borbori]
MATQVVFQQPANPSLPASACKARRMTASSLLRNPLRRHTRPYRWRQRRQAVGAPGIVTARLRLAIGPGRLEIAAWAGALIIERAAHALAHFTEQGDTAGWFALGAAHGNPMRRDQHHLIIRHRAASRLALTPEERHTKMRAAGATRKTRINVRHDSRGLRNRQGPAPGGYSRPSHALVKCRMMAVLQARSREYNGALCRPQPELSAWPCRRCASSVSSSAFF